MCVEETPDRRHRFNANFLQIFFGESKSWSGDVNKKKARKRRKFLSLAAKFLCKCAARLNGHDERFTLLR